MEIRFKVSDKFMADLEKKLGLKNATEVTREGLLALSWMAKEVSKDREILSGMTKKGENDQEVIQPKEIYPGPCRLKKKKK